MPEHPNVQRLRVGYEAYRKGDLATLRGLFADDVGFHFLGHSQLSGDYHGLGEVLGYFERLRESGARFTFDVHACSPTTSTGSACSRARRSAPGGGLCRRWSTCST